MVPFAEHAAATVRRLRRAWEGEPEAPHYQTLSEQRSTLLGVAERLLLLADCELARAVVADDGDAAARAGGLLAKFASIVEKAVGLDPREHAVSLIDYVREREAHASEAIGAGPEPRIEPADDHAATAAEKTP